MKCTARGSTFALDLSPSIAQRTTGVEDEKSILHVRSLFAAGIFVGIVGSAAIHAQQAESPTRQILKSDLQGIPGQETLFFTTDWAPGQALRCRIHPEGHEFAYLIEGELTFKIKGVGEKIVKAGGINHVLPDVPHYGRNASDKLARTLVVRVKDKNKPIAVDVEASNCP